MLLILLRREKMSENKTMNVILVKPGCDPEICRIPDDVKLQIETISDLLEGNFASCELLDLGNGASLHLLVNDLVIVELKTVEEIKPVHQAQLLTYMKILEKPQGLLINFFTDNIIKSMKPFVNEYFTSLPD